MQTGSEGGTTMLRQQARAIEAGVRVLDLVLLVSVAPLAYAIRNLLKGFDAFPAQDLGESWPPLVVALLLWLAASWMFGVYTSFRTASIRSELGRIGRSLAAVAIVMAAGGFALKEHQASRMLIGLYFTFAFMILAAARLALRTVARAARRRGFNLRMYAIIGSGRLAREVVTRISEHPEWGFQFAGYILDEKAPLSHPRGTRVLGRISELPRILDENVLDEVVFAVPRERLTTIEQAILLCQEQGVAVRICLDCFRYGTANMSLGDVEGMPMLDFTRTPTDPLGLFVKRAFDILVSATLLLLLFPVALATAIAIKLGSPGPVHFKQRRVGRNGRPFDMLKFRSMYVDAEARLESLRALNEASGPVFKIRNDPRITRVGRFIRRTSIDELPQFWNVLRGDMSVVGPRPPIPSEVRQYQRWQRRRLSVRPGITCTWQVSGRSDIDFEEWMELDLDYIDHWSIWGDIRICAKTIPAVLSARGAH
jgi:exopolysaccharide biosynthesis polyprenyl glycosylphosphotransferase